MSCNKSPLAVTQGRRVGSRMVVDEEGKGSVKECGI